MLRSTILSLLAASITCLVNTKQLPAEVFTYKIEGTVVDDAPWGTVGTPMVGYFSYRDDLPVYLNLISATSYGYRDYYDNAPGVYSQLYFQAHTLYSTNQTRIAIYDNYSLDTNTPAPDADPDFDLFELYAYRLYSPTLSIPPAISVNIHLRDLDYSVFNSTQIPDELPPLSEFEYKWIFTISGSYRTEITSLTRIHNADLNGDGFVGIDDLDIVLNNWNQDVILGDRLTGDASNDGFIGLDDLDIVLSGWNAGASPTDASIPEPTTTLLLTTAVFSLLNHRRTT